MQGWTCARCMQGIGLEVRILAIRASQKQTKHMRNDLPFHRDLCCRDTVHIAAGTIQRMLETGMAFCCCRIGLQGPLCFAVADFHHLQLGHMQN